MIYNNIQKKLQLDSCIICGASLREHTVVKLEKVRLRCTLCFWYKLHSQSVNRSINWFRTTQLWINRIKRLDQQKQRKKEMFSTWAALSSSPASHLYLCYKLSGDTRFVGTGVKSRAKPDTLYCTRGIWGFLSTSHPEVCLSPWVGGSVRHKYSERELLLSGHHLSAHLMYTPTNKHALIQLHKLHLHGITEHWMKAWLVRQESPDLSVKRMAMFLPSKTSTITIFSYTCLLFLWLISVNAPLFISS